MRRGAGQPGFTLLEVVFAVSLSLVLMAAMLGLYKQASEVRAAVLEEVRLVGAERVVMELVTEELQSAFVYQFLGQGMSGGIGRMQFTSLTLPGGAAWLRQSVTETEQVAPERDLQMVGYGLRIVEDEYGDLVVAGLERTVQKTLTAREAEEGEEIEAELLAPDIKFLRLAYWDGSAWVETWDGGDLPEAVEIVLGNEPLPEGLEPIEYPYPTFRRVVYIPSATRREEGVRIRGLGGMGRP